jgi:hypothetical protein
MAHGRKCLCCSRADYNSDIVVVDTSGSKSFVQSFSGAFGLVGMLIRPW